MTTRQVNGNGHASPPLPTVNLRRPLSSDSMRPLTTTTSVGTSSSSNPPSPLPRRHLRTSSSSSSLSYTSSSSIRRPLMTRSSMTNLRKPPSSSSTWAEPTLSELMQAEEQGTLQRHLPRRRASATSAMIRPPTFLSGKQLSWDDAEDGIGDDEGDDDHDDGKEEATIEWERMMMWRHDPPQSADLYPPLYGRPGPTPSPDIFAALLQPLLSLSRPPSPAPSIHSSPQLASEPPSTIPDRSASSLPAHFPPRNSTDPGPTVESQGFVLYIGSLVAWLSYLVWSLVPDRYLQALGIAWYPSREWSLLVPAWTIMLAAFVYFSYIALNIFITPPISSYDTLTDPMAFILHPSSDDPHPLITHSILLPPDAVPPLHDLPIGWVNRVVFGDYRRKRGRGWGSLKAGKSGEQLDREWDEWVEAQQQQKKGRE